MRLFTPNLNRRRRKLRDHLELAAFILLGFLIMLLSFMLYLAVFRADRIEACLDAITPGK